MDSLIYTMVRAADWRAAEAVGEYRGSADDRRDGFLHFSAAGQLRSDLLHRDREAGGEPVDDHDEGLAVRLAGGQVAEHRPESTGAGRPSPGHPGRRPPSRR